MKYSAYIPCYNQSRLLIQTIESLRHQTIPPDEILVVDDGSSDDTAKSASEAGVRIIRHEKNLGRGAARARAILEVTHELVLGCDAGKILAPNFSEKASAWFKEPNVAAVYGKIVPSGNGVVARWEGRHLFNSHVHLSVRHGASLATGGMMLRKSHVLAAGNFRNDLRQAEDRELGERLIARGFDVVFDPELVVKDGRNDTAFQALERYWRWNTADKGRPSLTWYAKIIWFSLKVMAPADLRSIDPMAMFISLACPHYQFWKTCSNQKQNKNNR